MELLNLANNLFSIIENLNYCRINKLKIDLIEENKTIDYTLLKIKSTKKEIIKEKENLKKIINELYTMKEFNISYVSNYVKLTNIIKTIMTSLNSSIILDDDKFQKMDYVMKMDLNNYLATKQNIYLKMLYLNSSITLFFKD